MSRPRSGIGDIATERDRTREAAHQLARRLYQVNGHLFEDEVDAGAALGCASAAHLDVHSERWCIATKFGRDFWGYELIVRNAGPGMASSVRVTPVRSGGTGWVPEMIGCVASLTGGTIGRLGPGESARLEYETVDDDHRAFTWSVRWADGDGERRGDFPATKDW